MGSRRLVFVHEQASDRLGMHHSRCSCCTLPGLVRSGPAWSDLAAAELNAFGQVLLAASHATLPYQQHLHSCSTLNSLAYARARSTQHTVRSVITYCVPISNTTLDINNNYNSTELFLTRSKTIRYPDHFTFFQYLPIDNTP